MDRVPLCFIEETIWLLDSIRRGKPYEPLTLQDSLWGSTATRELKLDQDQALQLSVWNDSASRTTRFYIDQGDRPVSLKEVERSRISRVRFVCFGLASSADNEFEELNRSNLARLCAVLARNVSYLNINIEAPFDFNDFLVSQLILSLKSIGRFFCCGGTISDFVRLALKRAKELEAEVEFRCGALEITEKTMNFLCDLTSSKRLKSLFLLQSPGSPINANACLNRILDCLETSGIDRNFTFTGCAEKVETVTQRAKSLNCQFEYRTCLDRRRLRFQFN